MLAEVSPLLHKYLKAGVDWRLTLVLQTLVAPVEVTTGLAGKELTKMFTLLELSERQPFREDVTEKEPDDFTVMLLDVDPLLQLFPKREDDVNITESPLQKVVDPNVEILGVEGLVFTVTTVAKEESDKHPLTEFKTEKLPEALTVMLLEVDPLFQRLPDKEDDVKITESPLQKVVDPNVEILGVLGIALTVTTVAKEESDEHPLTEFKTEKLPEALTVMLLDVDPLLQLFPKREDDVNITESPLQKVVDPNVEILGVEGLVFTVTTVAKEESDKHPLTEFKTEKLPEALTVMLLEVDPLFQRLPDKEDDVKITESPLQKVVDPNVKILGVLGFALTVTTVAKEESDRQPWVVETSL